MGLVLFVVYLALAVVSLCKRKSFFSLTLIYLIIAPQIKIGTKDIDAMYLVIILLCALMMLKKEKIKIKKNFLNYLVLIIFNFMLYFIMTLVYSSTINSSLLASIVGFIKLPVLIILISNYFEEDLKKEKNFDTVFIVTLLINTCGVIAQWILGKDVRSFFESMYLSDSYNYYSYLSDKVVYNRKMGFFPSPMLLGIFCAFVLIYFLKRYSYTKEKKFIICFFIALVVGISSLSKTFILGVPIIFILYITLNFLFKLKKIRIRKKRIYNMIIIIPIAIIVIISFINLVKKNAALNYYFSMLSNPTKSLETRYSVDSNDILLSKTYEVIEEHQIFGVGFESIKGEFIGDSTYVLALHNGGMFSLISIVIFYGVSIIETLRKGNIFKLIFISFWIISGIGMPTLFNVMMVLPFYLYFFSINNAKTKVKINENKLVEDTINEKFNFCNNSNS